MERRKFFGGIFSGLVASTLKIEPPKENENDIKFNEAIKLLKSEDKFEIGKGLTALYGIQAEEFSEKQIKIICQLLDENILETQTYYSLLYILTNQKSATTHKFFLKIFPGEQDNIGQLAVVKYFIRSGFDDLLILLRLKILNSSKQYESFVTFLGFIATDEYGKEAMNLFLNDIHLIDKLNVDTLKMLKAMVEGYLNAIKFGEEYNKSYLKSFLEKVKAFGE